MQHLTWDPVFDRACGDKTVGSRIGTSIENVTEDCIIKHQLLIEREIQNNGGLARKIVLRRSTSIDDHPLVEAKRAVGIALHPNEDPDTRFPILDLRGGKSRATANANRNLLSLHLKYQQLWDEVVRTEAGWQFDYVMFLRDDTLWLSDFDLNRLIRRGHADFYVLSCDARIPRMQPAEINDHGGVVSRRHAELFGSYFNQLFHVNLTECHMSILQHAGHGKVGCNSEMILKWILARRGVTTREVGQGLIPLQRSLRLKKPEGGATTCFHKYCQSHRDSLAHVPLQRCEDVIL